MVVESYGFDWRWRGGSKRGRERRLGETSLFVFGFCEGLRLEISLLRSYGFW